MNVGSVGNPEDDAESKLQRFLDDLYDRLGQNDPNLNNIDTMRYQRRYGNLTFDNLRAIELGTSLQSNTIVEKIYLNVRNMTLRGTGELANYIATSHSLKEFRMLSDHMSSSRRHRNHRQINAVVDRFLSAVAYNGNLQKLEIPRECSSIPLATALQANHYSLTELDVSFQGSTTDLPVSQVLIDNAEIVAASISTLQKLKRIDINCQKDICFTTSTIHNLMNHPELHYFNLTLYDIGIINIPAYAYLLQDLFRSTTQLESIDLSCLSLEDKFTDVLPVVLSGFYGHPTIRSLSLQFYTSNDENAIAICDLLQNNPGITSLSVQVDTLHGFALIVESLNNNETLRDLDVNITKASKKKLSNIEACRQLENSLPFMKHLTYLEFKIQDHPDNIVFPSDIMNGLKGNYCLTFVYFEWEDQNTDKERKLAKFYTERNTWLPKLLDATTKDEVLNLFLEMKRKEETLISWNEEEENYYLTIVYETLRRKDIFW